MSTLIMDVAGWSVLIGLITLFPANILLTVLLRKRRRQITNQIVEAVPSHMQQRVRFVINSNMSWVFGTLGFYTWFGWLLLKYGWGLTTIQLKEWHKGIRRAYGEYIYLAYLSMFGANLLLTGAILFFVGSQF